MRIVQKRAAVIFLVIVFILKRFRHRFFTQMIHFKDRFQSNAFSIKRTLTALAWTEGLSALRCILFQTKTFYTLSTLRACLHEGRGPEVGEVTHLGVLTRLFIQSDHVYIYLRYFQRNRGGLELIFLFWRWGTV